MKINKIIFLLIVKMYDYVDVKDNLSSDSEFYFPE